MNPTLLTIGYVLDYIKRIEQQFGPTIAAAAGHLFRATATITYTDEQREGLLERELTAMELRADDLRRAAAVVTDPPA